MKILAFITCTIVILISGLFFASLSLIAHGQATTEVSGLINTNMIWAPQYAPFVFTGPVTISNGVTLTIQPGVSVILSSYTLTINGTLIARGNATTPVRFIGGNTGGFDPIIFTSFSAAWNEQTAAGCIIENAILTASGIDIENASPKINACILSGSDIVINDPNRGTPIISNNTIKGVINISTVGVTCGGNAVITGNNISGWMTGIDIFLGNATIMNNLVWNNSAEGIRIDYRSDFGQITSPTLSNNTVVYDTVGVYLVGSPTPTIFNNNINNNTNYNINLYNGTAIYYPKGGSINATYNYWGTTNTTLISRTIYDFKNNVNLGNVSYTPFLLSPNAAAPPIPVPGIFIPEFSFSSPLFGAILLITFVALAAGRVLLRGEKTETSPAFPPKP